MAQALPIANLVKPLLSPPVNAMAESPAEVSVASTPNFIATILRSPAVQAMKETTSQVITRLQTDAPPFPSNEQWAFLLAFVVICVGYVLYQRLRYRWAYRIYLSCPGHFNAINSVAINSSGRTPIPSESLPLPVAGAMDFTYTMWLKVDNWYKNYGQWKHVYHQGTETIKACTDSMQWDSIQRQVPGIWMGPNVNDLRIVVSTQFVIPTSCESQFRASLPRSEGFVDYRPLPQMDAIDDQPRIVNTVEHFANETPPVKCSNDIALLDKAWTNVTTDTLYKYIQDNPSVYKNCTFQVQTPVATSDANTTLSTINLLEYVDVVNFPIGEWFQLGVQINSGRMEIYLNGFLIRSQVLLGAPWILQSAGYIGLGATYSGQISNFNYFPRDMPPHVMRYLYKEEAKRPMYDYLTESNYYW